MGLEHHGDRNACFELDGDGGVRFRVGAAATTYRRLAANMLEKLYFDSSEAPRAFRHTVEKTSFGAACGLLPLALATLAAVDAGLGGRYDVRGVSMPRMVASDACGTVTSANHGANSSGGWRAGGPCSGITLQLYDTVRRAEVAAHVLRADFGTAAVPIIAFVDAAAAAGKSTLIGKGALFAFRRGTKYNTPSIIRAGDALLFNSTLGRVVQDDTAFPFSRIKRAMAKAARHGGARPKPRLYGRYVDGWSCNGNCPYTPPDPELLDAYKRAEDLPLLPFLWGYCGNATKPPRACNLMVTELG